MASRSCILALVAATLALGAFGQGQAQAYWGAPSVVYCYDPCCPPVVTCYRTVYCDPCVPTVGEWYLDRRPGPVRRLFFGRYRWYWSPTVCCVVCGYDPCCCEPWTVSESVGEWREPTPAPAEGDQSQPSPEPEPTNGTNGRDSGTESPDGPDEPPFPTTPMQPPIEPRPGADGLPVNPTSFSQPTRDTSGLLTVYVPADAKVLINGYETTSEGSRREYVSYGLKEGLQYPYKIEAEVVREGKVYVETREVILTAGDKKGVAFSFAVGTVAAADVPAGL